MRWTDRHLTNMRRLVRAQQAQDPLCDLFEVYEPLNFWVTRLGVSPQAVKRLMVEGLPVRREGRTLRVSMGNLLAAMEGRPYKDGERLVQGVDDRLKSLVLQFPSSFLGPPNAPHERYWWSPVYLKRWLSAETWGRVAAPEAGGLGQHACRAWVFWQHDLEARGKGALYPRIRQMAADGLIRQWAVRFGGTWQLHPVDQDVWRFLYEGAAIQEAREAFIVELTGLLRAGVPLPERPFEDIERTAPLEETLIDEVEARRREEVLAMSGGVAPATVLDDLYKGPADGGRIAARLRNGSIDV